MRLLPERLLLWLSRWNAEGEPANAAADELARRWGS